MKDLAKVLLLIIVMIMGLAMLTGPTAGAAKLLKGQTLYLPISTSYVAGDYTFDVRATIFIHNTDSDHAINIVRMDYFDTSGKLVERYLHQPLKINPGAGTYIRVKNPLTGEEGTVSHFVVQWQAETRVNEPIVRGLMLGSAGTRGYTFETQTRIVQETTD